MTEYRFVQVDAFADRPFVGNPAAVVPLDRWLPDELLQAIAAENNLSETAFTIPAQAGADYELRWFTPLLEVALCGHATLAAGHVLISGERVSFRTRRSGFLEVTRDGERYALSLPAMAAQPRPLPEIVAALGIESLETFWHDKGYAVTVVESEDQVRRVEPDLRRLAALGDVLAIVTAPGRETDFVSRVFVPGGGIDEDPVTGSAHAVLAPYWSARLGRDRLSAFQASRRGGFVDCRLEGDRVILGGQCVTVIEGVLRL
jgi:PhzF family phenazine biosynthesis protein